MVHHIHPYHNTNGTSYLSLTSLTPLTPLTPHQNATASDSVEILAGDVSLSMSPTPAPSAAISVPPVSTPAPIAAPVGEPLTSPPELQWKVNDATGVRFAELEFGVVEIDNFWGYTITRGYNGQVRSRVVYPSVSLLSLGSCSCRKRSRSFTLLSYQVLN